MSALIGKTIKNVREMTKEELDAEGWDGAYPCIVIELNDGTKIYPSQDEEGNLPGAMFGRDFNGEGFMVVPMEEHIPKAKIKKGN